MVEPSVVKVSLVAVKGLPSLVQVVDDLVVLECLALLLELPVGYAAADLIGPLVCCLAWA